jgi:hypothetical protein
MRYFVKDNKNKMPNKGIDNTKGISKEGDKKKLNC